MEQMFMQVFERRDWVTAQMRQLVDSQDQSIALALLAAAKPLPPWLLPSCAGEPQELNGKPIVSELVFPGRQITTPATNRTVFLPPAVPSTFFRKVGAPNGDSHLETISDALGSNQHEEPQQMQNSELAEASTEFNMFSRVQRSRSRQRNIRDRLREKDKNASSGSSDGMQDGLQRSKLTNVGSNRTTASLSSRSRQRNIEDRLCVNDEAASSDGMQGRSQRSKLTNVGSNITTAPLSSKPCGDGANNAGTTSSWPGQDNDFYADQEMSTEFLKCSKDGDLGNQGVHLDCSPSLVIENKIDRSDNNVKVPYNSVRDFLRMQVADSLCQPIPETHLLVEPKKLQFDGVESVCINSANEQTMQKQKCALESAHADLTGAHPSNGEPSSTSCVPVPCSMGKSLLDGVESEYLDSASAPVKQHWKCALVRASLDFTGMHSRSEDPSLTTSSEVPNSRSGVLLEKNTWCISETNSLEGSCSKVSPGLEKGKISIIETSCFERPCSVVNPLLQRDKPHTVEDTERIRKLDCFSDQIITQNSMCLEQQCADSHVLHSPHSESLRLSSDTPTGALASSGILPDRLLEDVCDHLSHSLINGANSQCSQVMSAASLEQLPPQTATSGDVYQPSLASYKTQNNDKHSNDCPVVSAFASAENNLSQEQYLFARPSLESNGNFADVDTPSGHSPLGTQNETLNENHASDLVNCHSGKLGDLQVKFLALTKAHAISVISNKKNESAVPKVMGSISDGRTSMMHTTDMNSMPSAEKCTGSLQQDGTEQEASPFENIVQMNYNSCAAEKDKQMKSSRPSVQYFLRSSVSHEKINLLQSDGSNAACGQKRSVADGVQVNGGLSSKRRRIRCRSDINLSRPRCANSLPLKCQVGIDGHMLTAANFSEKSPSLGRYLLRSSESSADMSLKSEGRNIAIKCKMSVASDIHENGNSSPGRRNTSSPSNVVLPNSPSASSSRSALVGRVFKNSPAQLQNNLEIESVTTPAALPSCSCILFDNKEHCTQEGNPCLEGQDLKVTNSSLADQQMSLQMDDMPSRSVILNQENYSGTNSFIFPTSDLHQYGEQTSAPNALVHDKLSYGSNVELDRKCKSYDPKGCLLSGAASPRQAGDESLECDDTMPEFERFNIPVQFDSPARKFEALCDSRQLVTSSSDFLNRYNISTSSVHQLLATMSEKPTNCSFPVALDQYSASNHSSLTDTVGACGLRLDGSLFISDAAVSCSSNASNKKEISETPLTPSVEKYSLGKLSLRSGSGSERMGSIPELACFRIDEEDSSIAEESEYQDRAPGSVDTNYSHQWPSGRKALQDITGLCQNIGAFLSTGFMDTGNIHLTAETVGSELNHHSNVRTDHDINKTKENHLTSVLREGKVSRSLHDRSNMTEILDSKNGRHMSEANLDKRSKPSNIVANVSSFIPLVKPKLQPTTACLKKDVKVKALEAAEVAKRLEEKKQNERERRKAAAKLERERLKQEKELKQKQEEEQKKKRGADVATRKRQREEEERKEKERKRKCIDDTRKQQKQPMDRRRTANDDKDARRKVSDNKVLRKNLVGAGKSQVKSDETTEPALEYMPNKDNKEKGVTVDERPASFGSHAKENIPNNLEEPYKMSPFKDSDEEDDDDFELEQESRRRRKMIPSWARKENLDKILLSNQTLDPREIFAQKCSFNISDVLLAHIPQRGFR